MSTTQNSASANKAILNRCALSSMRIADLPVGMAFAVSGIIHVNNPYHFLNSVLSYQIVSGAMATVMAIGLPPLMFLVGVCLLFAVARFAALLVSSLLLTLFAGAQMIALNLGLEIDCGCFGSYSNEVSGYSLAAVLVLLVFSTGCFCAELARANKRDA